MNELENKYVNLLLERCLNFNKSKSLFISYNKINKDFVSKVVEKAKSMGITDIYLDEEDSKFKHDKLKNITIEEIQTDPYFDKSIWDVYAEKNASFLMLETVLPNYYDDIEPKIISESRNREKKTRPLFRKKETTYEIPWNISALPNELWAKSLFKEENANELLYKTIFKICMIDTENPIDSWNNELKKLKVKSIKLTNLKIKKLHYKNSLGTNLTLTMPKEYKWLSCADDSDMLVNMPSYEVFTSPDFRYTEGIVYSSRPLIYGGGLINDFYLKFKDGKVVEYDAKTGKEILKGIIESDSNSSYLGECALINYSSPISDTKLVFQTTLFDENASCHLALGDSFPEALKDGDKLSDKELMEKGLNKSTNHVDFMIGTKDLEIIAETENGNVQIFKDGNFVI